jgi:chromosome segregation ATPase
MKILQNRISELERSIEGHERERSILLKELDNVTLEKKMIFSNLEEANKKMIQLEVNARSHKQELKDLSSKLEEALTNSNEFESKCKGLELSLRHLEKEKNIIGQLLQKKEQENMATSKTEHHLSKMKEI